MTTKWDVLDERLTDAMNEVDRLIREMVGMHNTPCGLTCVTCQEFLATEADFAKHFVLEDTRFLNLGNCPNRGEWRAASDEETQNYLAGYRFYDKREWRETDNGLEVKVD